MTEEEWLSSDDPALLITSVRNLIHTRKAALFGLVCARTLAKASKNPAFEQHLAKNERRIETGIVEAEPGEFERSEPPPDVQPDYRLYELARSDFETNGELDPRHEPDVRAYISDLLAFAWSSPSLDWWNHFNSDIHRIQTPPRSATDMLLNAATETLRQHIPHLRCIVGNPFRPVSFSPAWRTTTAVAIANGMYESRDFGPMPLLADALQDAGCEVPEIIDHCRGPGPHVRGCWVVDCVLGKS